MKLNSLILALFLAVNVSALAAPMPTIAPVEASPIVVVIATPDPGYCGVYPFETGEWDALHGICIKHDQRYNDLIAGHPSAGFWETTGEFAKGAAIEEIKSLYTIVAAPLYTLLVVTIGGGLWVKHSVVNAIRRRKEDEDEEDRAKKK